MRSFQPIVWLELLKLNPTQQTVQNEERPQTNGRTHTHTHTHTRTLPNVLSPLLRDR